MYNKLLSVAILISFYLTYFVGAANNNVQWFLYKENLFYIDMERNLNSYQAQQYCLENDMVYIIEPSDKYLLETPLFHGKYESSPILWILNENYMFRSPNKELPNECNALNEKDIKPEDCSLLKGLICKTRITGAKVQYKNGTFFPVGVDGANQFCDPRMHQYDNDIEYCLIQFQKLLL